MHTYLYYIWLSLSHCVIRTGVGDTARFDAMKCLAHSALHTRGLPRGVIEMTGKPYWMWSRGSVPSARE